MEFKVKPGVNPSRYISAVRTFYGVRVEFDFLIASRPSKKLFIRLISQNFQLKLTIVKGIISKACSGLLQRNLKIKVI
jgi:hypothetical protein